MKKLAVISLIILVIVFLSAIGIWYFYFRMDISKVDFKILIADALSNEEFKQFLGNENIERTQGGPVQEFTLEGYNSLNSANSTCEGKLNIGDKIRVVDAFTPTRDIAVVYSVNSNKFLCVAESPLNNV